MHGLQGFRRAAASHIGEGGRSEAQTMAVQSKKWRVVCRGTWDRYALINNVFGADAPGARTA
jgi:hypothetical protein